MEDVYPRVPHTTTRELYLRELGRQPRSPTSRGTSTASFWEVLSVDHLRLLRNTIAWAANEPPPVEVEGPGLLDVTAWRQRDSMTVHLVNLTNPMMMKGPLREVLPVGPLKVRVRLPAGLACATGAAAHGGDLALRVDAPMAIVDVTVPSVERPRGDRDRPVVTKVA